MGARARSGNRIGHGSTNMGVDASDLGLGGDGSRVATGGETGLTIGDCIAGAIMSDIATIEVETETGTADGFIGVTIGSSE